MMNSACWRVPMITTASAITSAFGHQYSAAPMASVSTARSSSTARLARHTERRVSSWTSDFGSALRKSSLNSSPFTLLVEATDQDVLHFEVFLDAVLRAFAAEAGLLDAAERGNLGRDDA